ncbi:hypothetical protein B0I21_103394 [Sphingobacterium paludis]|uniref:Uncharacterized protein n=1 Tax=Sphingobacterium paludis TaxID=1476465 RepID=A0A4R7D1N3_9SPHI|nr:hypothetical protein B0I21_103394 [Sphingobacterium paludis]
MYTLFTAIITAEHVHLLLQLYQVCYYLTFINDSTTSCFQDVSCAKAQKPKAISHANRLWFLLDQEGLMTSGQLYLADGAAAVCHIFSLALRLETPVFCSGIFPA